MGISRETGSFDGEIQTSNIPYYIENYIKSSKEESNHDVNSQGNANNDIFGAVQGNSEKFNTEGFLKETKRRRKSVKSSERTRKVSFECSEEMEKIAHRNSAKSHKIPILRLPKSGLNTCFEEFCETEADKVDDILKVSEKSWVVAENEQVDSSSTDANEIISFDTTSMNFTNRELLKDEVRNHIMDNNEVSDTTLEEKCLDHENQNKVVIQSKDSEIGESDRNEKMEVHVGASSFENVDPSDCSGNQENVAGKKSSTDSLILIKHGDTRENISNAKIGNQTINTEIFNEQETFEKNELEEKYPDLAFTDSKESEGYMKINSNSLEKKDSDLSEKSEDMVEEDYRESKNTISDDSAISRQSLNHSARSEMKLDIPLIVENSELQQENACEEEEEPESLSKDDVEKNLELQNDSCTIFLVPEANISEVLDKSHEDTGSSSPNALMNNVLRDPKQSLDSYLDVVDKRPTTSFASIKKNKDIYVVENERASIVEIRKRRLLKDTNKIGKEIHDDSEDSHCESSLDESSKEDADNVEDNPVVNDSNQTRNKDVSTPLNAEENLHRNLHFAGESQLEEEIPVDDNTLNHLIETQISNIIELSAENATEEKLNSEKPNAPNDSAKGKKSKNSNYVSKKNVMRHICPHRKKGVTKLGDDQHSAICTEYQSNFAEASQREKTSRRQWEESTGYVPEGGKIQLKNGKEKNILSSRNHLKVRTVQDKGNGRGQLRALGNETWSSRQVPKTMMVRPHDNLKAEGVVDFTTTHKQDFTQKKVETSGVASTESLPPPFPLTDDRRPSQNENQITKIRPTKKPNQAFSKSLQFGSQKAAGVKAVFDESDSVKGTFESNSSYNVNGTNRFDSIQKQDFGRQVMSKRSVIRPRTSLRPSGGFYSQDSLDGTLYSKATEQERSSHVQTSKDMGVEASVPAVASNQKTLPLRPPTSLKSDGVFESSTINQDSYKPLVTKKAQPIKPKTSYKLEGKFEGESTLNSDYKRWDTKRPIVQKPQDNFKADGSIDFTTTNISDYSPITADRTDIIRPKTSTKLEGEFQGTTTSRESFKELPVSRAETIVPKKSLEILDAPLSAETTSMTDYKKWNVDKPERPKPEDNLKPQGAMDFDVSHKIVSFPGRTSQSIENYYSKVRKPQDHDLLGAGNKKFGGETSYDDFRRWNVARPVVKKPENNLRQEGDQDFLTTQTADYTPKGTETGVEYASSEYVNFDSEYADGSRQILKDTANDVYIREESPKQLREENKKKPLEADMKGYENINGISPRNEENVSINDIQPLDDEKKYYDSEQVQRGSEIENDGYFTWDEIRPRPIRPTNNLKPEGGMNFCTTSGEEFVPRTMDRVKGLRPQTNTKITGDFEGVTTNQVMYSQVNGERVQAILPMNNIQVEGGFFNGETTSGREFQNWKTDRSLPILPKGNIYSEGNMEFVTTQQTEFEQKRGERPMPIRPKTMTEMPEGKFGETTTNQVMHPGYSVEKRQSIRPTNHLKPNSGKFVDDTTAKREFQNWGVKRATPIHPSNHMKQEGEMDFTTMNDLQFEEKPIDKVSLLRPHTSSKITGEFDGTTTNQIMFKNFTMEKPNKILPVPNLKLEKGHFGNQTTTQSEFQQWPYGKPSPIRHEDNIFQAGAVDYKTMNQEHYGVKQINRVAKIRPNTAPKETGDFDGTTTNQVMFDAPHMERVTEIRPHGGIELEKGQISNDTTSKREFQNWGYAKPNPIMPRGNINQEGAMDFTTTNQVQFEGKAVERVTEIRPKTTTKLSGEFEGVTTNQVMFQNGTGQRATEIRPRPNLMLEEGQFSGDTTTNHEFRNWEYSKPKSILPKGNLYQEGDHDFTTTNQTQFEEKAIDRVSEIRPNTSTKITGDFEGVTTNQVMFQINPPERMNQIRPQTNLHVEKGKVSDETTTNMEFQKWRYSKPSPIRPKGNLTQEGNIDFTTTNQTQFKETAVKKVAPIKPRSSTKLEGEFDDTTTNHVMFKGIPAERPKEIRPKGNIYLEKGTFQDETTANREFQRWNTTKASPIIPHENLLQEGNIEFVTSNQLQFDEKPIDRVKQIRPQTNTKISGNFHGTTTNQTMFRAPRMEKVHEIRPQSNIHLEVGKLDTSTTNAREYQQWNVERPAAIKHVATLKQEGNMQFSTTNQSEFLQKEIDRAMPMRPKTTNRLEGKFEGTTTNQTMFAGQTAEKVKPIIQQNNLHLEEGKFNDETTTGREFRQWVKIQPDNNVSKTLDSKDMAPVATESGKLRHRTGGRTEKSGEYSRQVKQDIHDKNVRNKVEEKNDNQTVFMNERMKNNGTKKGKSQGNISTVMADYGAKPIARVKAIIPEGHFKQEGTMEFSTTTGREYTGRQTENGKKFHHAEDVREEVAGSNVFIEDQEEQNEKEVQMKSSDRGIQESSHESWALVSSDGKAEQIVDGELHSRDKIPLRGKRRPANLDSSTTAHVPNVTILPGKPEKRFKPDDNLKPDKVPFNGDSTTRAEYQKWNLKRSSPKKSSNTLRQEGAMMFATTTSEDFTTKRPLADKRAQKPESHLKQTGNMEFSTTTRSSYLGNTTPKTKNLRPKSTLKIGGDTSPRSKITPASSRTGSPPTSVRTSDNTTTTRTDYVGHTNLEKTRCNRPPTVQKVGNGPFDATTITQSSFANPPESGGRPNLYKPESHIVLNGGRDFSGNTTYRCSFEATKGNHCPVLDIDAGRSHFTFKEEVDGHRFYLPLVQG